MLAAILALAALTSCAVSAEEAPGGADIPETPVPCVSVYEGLPGVDSEGYAEHLMIITFGKLSGDQPIAPKLNNNYPM